jgi:hypothetical protein
MTALLALALVVLAFATVMAWAHSRQSAATAAWDARSREQVKRELSQIELHRPTHIVQDAS